jgi:hypothetical protein
MGYGTGRMRRVVEMSRSSQVSQLVVSRFDCVLSERERKGSAERSGKQAEQVSWQYFFGLTRTNQDRIMNYENRGGRRGERVLRSGNLESN